MISSSNALDLEEPKNESEMAPDDDFFSPKDNSRDGSLADDMASLRQKGRSNAVNNYIKNQGHSLQRQHTT
jgi:hypothetical protein